MGLMAIGKPGNSNIFSSSLGFLRQAVDELKKVHAPTREETIRATIGVLVMVFVFAIFLGFTDWVVGFVMSKVLAS